MDMQAHTDRFWLIEYMSRVDFVLYSIIGGETIIGIQYLYNAIR